MTMKEWALIYASKGYRVMPLHTMVNGKCSCNNPNCDTPAKHPRIKAWQHNATTDTDQINRWFSMWPDSNIGIATGYESNLVVLDCDDPTGEAVKDLEIPLTLKQTTGSGGSHWFFNHPGGKIKSSIRFLPSLDSRADGAYIVAPPSIHHSGNIYEWTTDLPKSDMPKWMIEALEEKSEPKQFGKDDKVFEGGRNAFLASMGGGFRKQGLGYTGLFNILMTVNMSQCVPPLSELEVSQIARSIAGYPIETEEEKQLREHGEKVASLWEQSKHEMIAQKLKNSSIKDAGPSPNFLPKRGLIKDIAEYILSQSERPLPLLAVGAAMAFVGVLTGSKYRYKSGLRSNLYIVGLADSGTGKNKAISMIDKLSAMCGPSVEAYIGGNDIASGAGLLASVEMHRSRLFSLDEFGLWLQSVTSKYAGGYKAEILRLLMELYNKADGTYRGKEYGDQKLKPRKDIRNPIICVYGVSTHHTFNEALTSGNAVDGSLSRMIIIPDAEERPERVRPTYQDPHPEIIKRIEDLVTYKPAGNGNFAGRTNYDVSEYLPQEVGIDEDVEEAWIDLDESMTEYMTGPSEKAIYSRVAENTLKLAITYAVSVNHYNPRVDHEGFVWARDIVLWCANKLLERVKNHIADNDIERIYQRIEQAVSQAKEKGLTKSELFRLAGRSVKPYEFDQYVGKLIEDGSVVFIRSEHEGKGRPSERFYLSKYIVDK